MKRLGFLSIGVVLYGYVGACSCVSPPGQPVKFGDQSNIIVWNPETKTEHFVRNAFFDSTSKDFGFIAPTPSMPKLDTAETAAYDTLARLQPTPASATGANSAEGKAAAANEPEVLQEVQVGKYDATTLRSDDTAAIASYLKKHGYETSADFESWAGFYAKKGWVLTAFKVRKGKEGQTETGIIRMSFKTDKPFNPYYVPKNNQSNQGTLKIYFVSDGTYSALLGGSKKWRDAAWNAPVPNESLKKVASELKLQPSDFPSNAWVTSFVRYEWLAGADEDLFFKRDANQPGNPMTMVMGASIAALAGGLWWFTRTRKMKLAA